MLRSLLRLERAHHRVRLGAVRHGHGVRHEGVVLARQKRGRVPAAHRRHRGEVQLALVIRRPRRVRRLWRTSARSSSRHGEESAVQLWLPMYSLVAAPAGTATVPFRKQSSASPGTARSAASAAHARRRRRRRRVRGHGSSAQKHKLRTHERDVVRDDASRRAPGQSPPSPGTGGRGAARRGPPPRRRAPGTSPRRRARFRRLPRARRTRASRSRARPSPPTPTPTPTRGRSKWRPCASRDARVDVLRRFRLERHPGLLLDLHVAQKRAAAHRRREVLLRRRVRNRATTAARARAARHRHRVVRRAWCLANCSTGARPPIIASVVLNAAPEAYWCSPCGRPGP